ncbi:PBP1A family penicillin-binding protein [Paenibacillus sp. GSMTC-2017]|uniref:transglycosylase domain-containing protein n=1 Tax=Paenibacillus sp. GSMTC-2017 TaxID=2794350 RepID=UPI0018D67385|nr:PBP1A family penicillin-binding protein [Paenibacillus sp. GSMTC-2017]MBH5316278.1 PBP1A family penicillin-binding protein [Paenibacillus sp. GSMTC-2017]
MRKATRHTHKRHKVSKKKILIIFGLLFLLISGISLIGLRMLVAAQDVTQLDRPLPAATILFDENGHEAVTISLNKIEPITYDKIPKHMIDAIIAVEDRRFNEHKGMDVWGISRALIQNLTSGKTVQGGSTITQQLAKNVFLTHERTWKRKWNEVLLAKKIEEQYSKDQIITMYLNQIYYGEGAWGIKRAAEVYYGKPVERLTIAESALLAGLVKAPSVLSPYKRPEQAIERRNIVLSLMLNQGYIEQRTHEDALQESLKLRESKPNRSESIQYPFYTDQVIREAIDIYGLTENDVLHGGLRIYTTLNTDMQKAAEQIFEEDDLFPKSMSDQLIQAGAILIDPRTGGIKSLVGGRGPQPFRGYNRAVQLSRQPGSTMKPIAVYTPALENGFQLDSRINDEPTIFGSYEPKNADNTFHGNVSIYEALTQSYNIPAVKLLNEIGIDQGIDASSRFGITLKSEDRTLGLALGGTKTGVSPLQMAEAYGAFANDGIRMSSHAIVRIESANGTIVASREEEKGIRVTTTEVARIMTTMLKGVIDSGTGKAAAIEDREVAGKTGTTEMPGVAGYGARDNWFVGYTPQLVGSVWLGYDKPDSSHYLTTSSKAAAVVFKELMSSALQGQPAIPFPFVKGINAGKQDHAERVSKNKSDNEKKRNKEKEKEERNKEKEEKKRNKEKEEKKRDREKRDKKESGEHRND